MVKVAAYRTEKDYDEWLETTVNGVKEHIKDKNDDFLVLIVGATGSGKSHLGLHILEQYLGEQASVNLIGLDKEGIAGGLQSAKNQPLPRFFMADEANLSKRDAMSKWNKELLDLYFAIRKLQIFHIWCNPSLDIIDKPFIEEKIKGFIYIPSKTKNARVYFYFTKQSLIKIYEKYGDLKLRTLHKVRKRYAYYRGWFKEYNGFLKEEYNKKKDSRMDTKVDEFAEKWGMKQKDDSIFRRGFVGKLLGLHKGTIKKYQDILVERGLLVENDNYFISASGHYTFNKDCLQLFQDLAKERRLRAKASEIKPK
jgi:ABC-type dipeptide/oligopeptide/nickel transport system ATPase component